MATDTERIEQLEKTAEQKTATSLSLSPWQEHFSRFTTVPGGKVSQAADVIAGMAGGWAAFWQHGNDISHDATGIVTTPQLKSYKLGQPGMPEINFPPYSHRTNRFGPKGPSLIGHPIALSVVGPTLKSDHMDWQWLVTDNSGTPGVGDDLVIDGESVNSPTAILLVANNAALVPGDLITIVPGPITLTAVAGVPGVDQWQIGGTAAATATNIAAAINNPANSTFGLLTAVAVGDEVFINVAVVLTSYLMTETVVTPGALTFKVNLAEHKTPAATSLIGTYSIVNGVTDYAGGLYLVVSQTGAPGDVGAYSTDTGLSDGFISDVTGSGKAPLVPLDHTSKYEIFKVDRASGSTLTLSPNKRLADYFTIPGGTPVIRAITLFEPYATRLAAVPGSGEPGAEQTFMVVSPETAATGEYLPPLVTWIAGSFDLYDSTNLAGITDDYHEKVALPVPRPNYQRQGRPQYTTDPPVPVSAGRMVVVPFSPTSNASVDDIGKILHVFRATHKGPTVFWSPAGDYTTDDRLLGWYEVIDVDYPNAGDYLVRRLVEVDPNTGRPFWGSTPSLSFDDFTVSGDLILDFTVHDAVSELFTSPYYQADKVESARLTTLIDPAWVERSAKTLTDVEGFNPARPDKAIWDTTYTNPMGGANPGSLLDLGFRMVLFPAMEGAIGTPLQNTIIPDYEHPITSREVVLDPSITDEPQFIDIDYSAGVVRLSHAPVPGPGCEVAPNGIITTAPTNYNPREEIILFAACVPYSMEEGQRGAGIRATAQASEAGAVCTSLGASQADVYGARAVVPVLDTFAGVPQVITSGVHQTIILDDVQDQGGFIWPHVGVIELRQGDETGPPVFPVNESLGLFGYTDISTVYDPVAGRTYLQLLGVYGGGDAAVPDQVTVSSSNPVVAVLRRDVRTPVDPLTGDPGVQYAQDTTYGFAKRSYTLRFEDAELVPQVDGSMVVRSSANVASELLHSDLFSSWAISGGTLTFPGLNVADIASTVVIAQGRRVVLAGGSVTVPAVASQEYYFYVDTTAWPACPSYAYTTALPLPTTDDILLGRADTGTGVVGAASTGVFVMAGVAPGNTCWLAGIPFTGVVGPGVPAAQTFDASGGDPLAATELIAAINDPVTQGALDAAISALLLVPPGTITVEASSGGPGVVNLTATVPPVPPGGTPYLGILGDGITILGGAGIVTSGPTLGGGIDPVPPALDANTYIDLRNILQDVDRRVDITVGEYSGAPSPVPHYSTLAEAIAYVSEIMEPPSGASGRSWRIKVIGSTDETGNTPIVMPTSGIIIEGASNRDEVVGTDMKIQWADDNPLFELNGQDDLTFKDLPFKYTGAGPDTPATRYVFGNDIAGAGTLTVNRLKVSRCTLDGGQEAHGLLAFLTVTSALQYSLIEDCTLDVADFGIVAESARYCTFQRNSFSSPRVAQQLPWDAAIHIVAAENCIARDNWIRTSSTFAFRQSVVLKGGFGNQIVHNFTNYTLQVPYHVSGYNCSIRDNTATDAHLSASLTVGQPVKTCIFAEGVGATGCIIEGNHVDIDSPGIGDLGILTEAINAQIIGNYSNRGITTTTDTRLSGNVVDAITTGDTCRVEGNDAVSLAAGQDNIITGNKIPTVALGTGCSFHNNRTLTQLILADGCIVDGNQLLQLDTNTATVDSVRVTGNTFSAGSAGAGSNGYTNSTIVGNQFGSVSGGIAIAFDDGVFADNILMGTAPTVQSVQLTGSNNRVTSNRLKYGNLVVAGIGNTVTGNNALYLTATGNNTVTITGNTVAVDLSCVVNDATLTGNIVVGDLSHSGSTSTVTANIVDGDMTVTNDEGTISSNAVVGSLLVTGTGAVVDGNKVGGILVVVGAGAIVSDNEPDQIRSTGDRCIIESNAVARATHTGTANSSTASTIVVPTQSEPDDYFNRFTITITGGLGAGQTRTITDWVAGTTTATITPNWSTNPDATSTYTINGGQIITGASADVQITGNIVTGDVEAYGSRSVIQGNNMGGHSIVLSDDSSYYASWCNISNNIEVDGIHAPSPCTSLMIANNLGGGTADWNFTGPNCTFIGNNLGSTSNLIASGGISGGLVIIGNITPNIGSNAAGAGPWPTDTVVMGNKVSGLIYGTNPSGAHIDPNIGGGLDHNDN